MKESPSAQPSHESIPRRRRSSRDARERQMLDAALAEFAEKGFAAARLEDIAARIGVTRANVYLYYPGKAALFEAAVRRWLEPSIALIEKLADGDGSARDALFVLIERVYAQLAEPEPRQILKIVVGDGRRFPDVLRLYQETVLARGAGAVARLLRRGVDAGEFPVEARAAPPQIVLAPTFMAAIWLTTFDAQPPLDVAALKRAHRAMLERWLALPPSDHPTAKGTRR